MTMDSAANDTKRGPLRWVGHWIAQVLVGIYVVVDAILGPVFRPFMRWLSGLNVIKAVERGIQALPPYAILALLAAPFVAEEVFKVYGIVLMGNGHFKTGLLIYIACHVFSILICERIFHAGKDKLMTIGWFARLFDWLNGYKERMVAWFRTTDAYKQIERVKKRLGEAAHRALGKTKAAFGR